MDDSSLSPRAFLSDLLIALGALPFDPSTSAPPSNLLDATSAPPELRSLLLTLHALFPHELLPALDLLDRRLVTRLIPYTLPSPPPDHGHPVSEQESTAVGQGDRDKAVYYVQSTAGAFAPFASEEHAGRGRGRPRRSDADAHATMLRYEVRLRPWNCSCPAFAFAAFEGGAQRESPDGDEQEEQSGAEGVEQSGEEREEHGGNEGDGFGGLRRRGEGAVCKHLLACLLVDRCKVFEGCVEEKVVDWKEMAGWAAGWVE